MYNHASVTDDRIRPRARMEAMYCAAATTISALLAASLDCSCVMGSFEIHNSEAIHINTYTGRFCKRRKKHHNVLLH
jgi:hypothetical protein